MVLLLTILLIIIPLLCIVYFIISHWVRHAKLQSEYSTILSFPISRIPFVGNLHQIDKEPHLFLRLLLRMSNECQQQQKGVFCLWFSIWPMIFFCTGEAIETFINKQLVKPFEYTLIEPWLKTGLLTNNNAKWRSRRRIITPSFHDTQLLINFLLIFKEQSCILARRLEKLIVEQAHDLDPYFSACTLDIISEAALGENPGAQWIDDNNCNNGYLETISRMGYIVNIRSRNPWMWPAFIFDRLPLGREQSKLLKILHNYSRKIIQNRLATFSEEKNGIDGYKKSDRRLVLIDSLLSQMHAEKLTLDDIQEEVDTFAFAGHDTTAAAVNFTCYLLGCHPDIQAKVHTEMDVIFGDDIERKCAIEDLQHMSYLDSVIKEAMRVLPPAPYVMREAQDDFVCHGQTIRKGTSLNIFIMGTHRDPNVFPNPEKFDPDRFSETNEVTEKHSPYTFIPFSAGSRNCIVVTKKIFETIICFFEKGQRFASLEIKVILSTLFRRFSFHATQTINELHLAAEAVLRPHTPIKMMITHRHSQ